MFRTNEVFQDIADKPFQIVEGWPVYRELALSTSSMGFAVISTQAGLNPLFMAFLTEPRFDHAVQ